MKLALKIGAALLAGISCTAQIPAPTVSQAPGGSASQPVRTPAVRIDSDGKPVPAESGSKPVQLPAAPFESGSEAAPRPATLPGGAKPAGPEAAVAERGVIPRVQAPEASPAGQKKSYVIGALDVLDIRVWNDPKMSGIFDVRTDGMLSMPLIGEFRADGLTVRQLTETVVGKLSDLINAPEVNIQVVRYGSKRYYVFGEVGRSGEFPLIAETTVLDALSNCGGFREFANQKKIYVLRGSKKIPFNYRDVSRGKRMEQNIVLENNDRIFVP